MKIGIELDLTTNTLAEMFISWGSDMQAEFFNLIGRNFKSADFSAELQCNFITDDVDKDGRNFIFTLANYLKVKKIPDVSPHFDTLIDAYPGDSLYYNR